MKTEKDDQGTEWKVIKSVGTVFGSTLNSKQLSAALKNECFNHEARIILHLKTGHPYPVKIVFKCSECENIHLLACGNITAEEKGLMFKDDIIYLDRTEPDSYVSIEDLTSLLDMFKDTQDISMDCVDGEIEDVESGTFTCAQVMKCRSKECKNAHLTCYYEDDEE